MNLTNVVNEKLIGSCDDCKALHPVNLRCEYLQNPLGVDISRPRLSWSIEGAGSNQCQSAYRIMVSSTKDSLQTGDYDLWDSGKVDGGCLQSVEYGGQALSSGQRAWWKVMLWDRDNHSLPESPPAWWEMGLLHREDWHGRWIAATTDTSFEGAPLLRNEFRLKSRIKRARAYICGLGYYELRLNGVRVGERLLDPAFTNYDKRVLYVTYDITSCLAEGDNAVGVILGNGWYNVHTEAEWDFHKAPWRASPRFLLEMRIEYTDGGSEIVSSGSEWKTTAGPVIYNSIYGGETYDARLEKAGWDIVGYDDTAWNGVKMVEPPAGALKAMLMAPASVMMIMNPVSLAEPSPDTYIYDMGQNFAGCVRLTVRGPRGVKVTLKYGERLNKDGTLDQENIAQYVKLGDPARRFQTDEYILKGDQTETWASSFTYHGFQYVEVRGLTEKPKLDDLCGLAINTAVERAGRFFCSNKMLNKVWRNSLWSYASNLIGYPTDCPHREKNGWTGDAHLAAEQGIMNFDVAVVYTKWMADLCDAQRDNGALPVIVPTGGWGQFEERGNICPAWDSAVVLIPWYMFIYYGDKRILKDNYRQMRRYVDCMSRMADDYIIYGGLGDWCPAGEETPVELLSTAYYYSDTILLSRIAGMLGLHEDKENYVCLAQEIQNAFDKKFFDPTIGRYGNGSQTSFCCALYHGLVKDRYKSAVLQRLLQKIETGGWRLDTGIMGAKYLLRVLTDNGWADIAYHLAAGMDYPGWGYWIKQGASTLWENWNGENSRNHIMFGDISAWFYQGLAGINADPLYPGFEHIIIRPNPVQDLEFVQAEYRSVRGRIYSNWRKEGKKVVFDIGIPVNTTATICLPADETEAFFGTGKVWEKKRRSIYEVGAGNHSFEIDL